jgi:haloalkane dehalogenase
LASSGGGSNVGRRLSEDAMDGKPAFTEHRVPREPGSVYARDYDGTGPAFVLMHGFPDNLLIYDDLIPYLTAAGRRVVTFDFLGFGASDKLAGASYSFAQQLGDLSAVIQSLGLGKVILVAHDSSGIAGINFAVEHPYNLHSAPSSRTTLGLVGGELLAWTVDGGWY